MNDKLLNACRQAYAAHIAFVEADAIFLAAKTAYHVKRGDLLDAQLHAAAVDGDMEGFDRLFGGGVEQREQAELPARYAIDRQHDLERLQKQTQEQKDQQAIAWYTKDGRDSL